MTKTIWIINQFAGHETSGWGERHYFIFRELINSGYDVTIISGSYNHLFLESKKFKERFFLEMHNGIRFCWVKTPEYSSESKKRFWSMIVFAYKVLLLNKKILPSPDHIIVSSMPIFSIVSGYYLKNKLKAKQLIFEVRDLWPLTPVYLGGFSRLHPFILFIGWCEKFGYRKADKIVSVLPNTAAYINRISGQPGKLFHIPNGVTTNSDYMEIKEPSSLKKIPTDKFIVGYTGTLGLANGMEYVVNAAKLLASEEKIHFVIVGDGYHRSRLEELSLGLRNITYIGKVLKNEVQSFINRFDACIISWHDKPLYKFGVSANKYFDYMLAGKPVISAGNFENGPVALSGAGIEVKPESPEAINAGILQLYAMSSEQRKEMGRKGKEYVMKFHTMQKLASQYEALL